MTTAESIVEGWKDGEEAWVTGDCMLEPTLVSFYKAVVNREECEVYVFEDGSSVEVYADRVEAQKP